MPSEQQNGRVVDIFVNWTLNNIIEYHFRPHRTESSLSIV